MSLNLLENAKAQDLEKNFPALRRKDKIKDFIL